MISCDWAAYLAVQARWSPRTVALREVVNGLMYLLSTGCQWRAVPKDLPARSTLHDDLGLWRWSGTLNRIHHTLYVAGRDQDGRDQDGRTIAWLNRCRRLAVSVR